MTETQDAVLARLDERTASIARDVAKLQQGYVTTDRFRPVEMLVYGQAGVMLLSIVSAILYLVVGHK